MIGAGLRNDEIPRHVLRKSLAQGDPWRVTQLGTGSADVRTGQPDIARLLGQLPDNGRLAKRHGNRVDELPQLDRIGVAEVVDMMAVATLDGSHDAVDEIGDERVVAS